MGRLLADENLNADIVRGLLLNYPTLDIVFVTEVGLSGVDDPEILVWAAENDRVLLTHDRATMPAHAYQRPNAGQALPGVFVVNDRFSVGQSIQQILLVVTLSEQTDWNGRVLYLPL